MSILCYVPLLKSHHLTDSLIVINDSLHTLILNTRNENLSDIREYNQDIVTTAEFEENERLINEITLATVEQGIYELSNEQKGVLENLIFECPAKGGRAVYVARSLYRLVNDTLTYNDDSICKAQAISWRLANPPKPTTIEVTQAVTVYPNPAYSEINIVLTQALSNDAKLLIYNSVGQIVKHWDLSSGTKQTKVDCKNMVAGVYAFQIIGKGNKQLNGKFVISH